MYLGLDPDELMQRGDDAMSRRRKTATLHSLLYGAAAKDDDFRVLFLVGNTLCDYSREHGLRPCPASWASRSLVLANIDPALVLGDRRAEETKT